MEEKKTMLSGIKPSGDLTLGSYLGPLHHWPKMIEEYDCYFFMADLHAITVRQEPAALRKRTLEAYADRILWNRMSLINIARSGIFAADRSIQDYARDIWHVPTRK